MVICTCAELNELPSNISTMVVTGRVADSEFEKLGSSVHHPFKIEIFLQYLLTKLLLEKNRGSDPGPGFFSRWSSTAPNRNPGDKG